MQDMQLKLPSSTSSSHLKTKKALRGKGATLNSTQDSESRTRLADLAKPDSDKPDHMALEDLNKLSQFNDFSAFQGCDNLRVDEYFDAITADTQQRLEYMATSR
jgi:hypothetical protein